MSPLSTQGLAPDSGTSSPSPRPSFPAMAKHLFLHVPRTYFRQAERHLWLASAIFRYQARSLFSAKSSTWGENSILSNQVKAMFINLTHRVDRRLQAESEFEALGLRASRIDAINHEIGLVGCALSHAKAIQTWIPAVSSPLLLIAEDDVNFVGSNKSIVELIVEFKRNAGLDVLCLSHVSKGPFENLSASLAVSVDTQTTGCYVIKPRAARVLRRVFLQSAKLIAKGKSKERYALDILWKKVQRRRLVFAVPREAVVIQRASYSDIQQTWVDSFRASPNTQSV